MFESLSRTVTCTRELISIYMCYSQGEGLNTSLSRLSYLEPGRDGKILSDHRQDGNDEVHRL